MKMTRQHKRSVGVRKPDGIITPTLMVLHYLCQNAREDEVYQYEAITGSKFDADTAAVGFWSTGPFRVAVAGPDNIPIAAGGYERVSATTLQSWMVGTQAGWDNHYRRIHQATRWLIETLADSGQFRRIQTTALTSRIEACQWYERLGMQLEGIHRSAGAGGEDVSMYARIITMEEAA